MGEYIDKETRNFLFIVAGLGIFFYFIFPRIDTYLLTADFSSFVSPITGLKSSTPLGGNVDTRRVAELEKGRDYKATINTSKGAIKIDLYEKNAPKNVSNFISLIGSYSNATFQIEKDYIIKAQVADKINYNVEDEINADYLLLNNTKVKDASFLRQIYDKNDPSTSVFEPNNLRKYQDFSLKQFYSEILGYKYSTTLATPKAVKYTIYMANTGPNSNKADFFILMSSSAPEIDGRYTPIGRVTEGFQVLDEINKSNNGSVSITGIVLE